MNKEELKKDIKDLDKSIEWMQKALDDGVTWEHTGMTLGDEQYYAKEKRKRLIKRFNQLEDN